jgi:cysteinyl-tRNA synthetase
MSTRLAEVVKEQRAGRPTAHTRRIQAHLKAFPAKFAAKMDDDLNVPGALALCQQLITAANRYVAAEGYSALLCKVQELFRRSEAELLGLFAIAPEQWSFQPWSFTPAGPQPPQVVETLVKAREQARREKDFARADQLRKQLEAIGIIIEDLPDGTTRIKR